MEKDSYRNKWEKTLKMYFRAIAIVWKTDKLFFGISMLFYFSAAVVPVAGCRPDLLRLRGRGKPAPETPGGRADLRHFELPDPRAETQY